jgi:hypothetical protein
VLNLASILGSALNDLSAYSLVDLSVGQTMSGMAQLVRLHILRERGDGLEFANELIRGHAYVRVPSPLRRALHGEIAGRLLTEAAEGVGRSGLEIAWHCFRGGRTSEGIPFLLSGAQSAIRAGAPHGVELALRSAMDSLKGEYASRARVLLVQALQEQGRWSDSTKLLEEIGISGTHQQDLCEVLRLTADYYMARIASDNANEVLSRLETLVLAPIDPAVQVRALTVAALILDYFGGGESVGRFLEMTRSIVAASLDEESQLRLIVAKALLCARSPEARQGFPELEAKTRELATSHIASLASAQLLHCAAAMHCSLGEYSRGSEFGKLAYRVAGRLDNEVTSAAAAANVALCCGRLGDYEEQVRWAQLAVGLLGSSFTGYRDIQVAVALGFGNAMLGREDEARQALERMILRLPTNLPAWMEQAWHLGRADVHQLLGRRKEALAAATQATLNGELHSDGFAGAFARWTAILALEHGTTTLAWDRVRPLRRNLHRYDALDQAEILAACTWMGCGTDARDAAAKVAAERRKLGARLVELPQAVSVQLARLGPRR